MRKTSDLGPFWLKSGATSFLTSPTCHLTVIVALDLDGPSCLLGCRF